MTVLDSALTGLPQRIMSCTMRMKFEWLIPMAPMTTKSASMISSMHCAGRNLETGHFRADKDRVLVGFQRISKRNGIQIGTQMEKWIGACFQLGYVPDFRTRSDQQLLVCQAGAVIQQDLMPRRINAAGRGSYHQLDVIFVVSRRRSQVSVRYFCRLLQNRLGQRRVYPTLLAQ